MEGAEGPWWHRKKESGEEERGVKESRGTFWRDKKARGCSLRVGHGTMGLKEKGQKGGETGWGVGGGASLGMKVFGGWAEAFGPTDGKGTV